MEQCRYLRTSVHPQLEIAWFYSTFDEDVFHDNFQSGLVCASHRSIASRQWRRVKHAICGALPLDDVTLQEGVQALACLDQKYDGSLLHGLDAHAQVVNLLCACTFSKDKERCNAASLAAQLLRRRKRALRSCCSRTEICTRLSPMDRKAICGLVNAFRAPDGTAESQHVEVIATNAFTGDRLANLTMDITKSLKDVQAKLARDLGLPHNFSIQFVNGNGACLSRWDRLVDDNNESLHIMNDANGLNAQDVQLIESLCICDRVTAMEALEDNSGCWWSAIVEIGHLTEDPYNVPDEFDMKDIQLVMSVLADNGVRCSRALAIAALRATNHDIVEAILQVHGFPTQLSITALQKLPVVSATDLATPKRIIKLELVDTCKAPVTCFLPEYIAGKRVLTPTPFAGIYSIDNTLAQCDTSGLRFRRSKSFIDVDPLPNSCVAWNNTVRGVLSDGWLEVQVLRTQILQNRIYNFRKIDRANAECLSAIVSTAKRLLRHQDPVPISPQHRHSAPRKQGRRQRSDAKITRRCLMQPPRRGGARL